MDEVQKHVCGRCNDEWLTEDEYNNHVCPETGFAPTQAEHQGPEFVEVQKAALQRGLEVAQANSDDIQAARNQEAIEQLNGGASPEAEAQAQAEVTLQ